MTKKFAVAVFTLDGEDELSLHIVSADSWQNALNASPATWWDTPQEMTLEEAAQNALVSHQCLIAVREITS